MKTHFNFYNSSVIVYGEVNSVLYDFNLNKIYHLQRVETNIVKELYAGKRIDEIKKKFNNDTLEELLTVFENKKLGEYYRSYIPHEPFRIGQLNSNSLEKITLESIFYELPCNCDHDCLDCFLPKTGGCITCKKVSEETSESRNNWDSYYHLLRDTVSMGFKSIYFHGGDPLTSWDNLSNIIDFTNLLKNKEQTVYLVTPYRKNSELYLERVNSLLVKKVRPIISLRYLPQKKSEFMNSVNILNCINELNKGEKTGIILNVVIESRFAHEKPLEHCKTNCLDYTFSYIVDGDVNVLEHNKYYYNHAVTHYSYSNSEFFHPCLKGTIAIDAKRRVHPCPQINDVLLQEYSYPSFIKLFQEYYELSPYWSLSLNKISPCEDCEFNRLCCDCRASELALGSEKNHKITCSNHQNLYQPFI